MTLFKPRLVNVHRPACLYHQEQSFMTTPTRVNWNDLYYWFVDFVLFKSLKEKSRPISSSTISLTQQSNGDLSNSGDDLSVSPRSLDKKLNQSLDDSETRQSRIPIPSTLYTPAASTLSRTSSRDSILSEHSYLSTSSTQRQRPSKLPVAISRNKKSTNGTTPVKNS
jgi:hypothetical protein